MMTLTREQVLENLCHEHALLRRELAPFEEEMDGVSPPELWSRLSEIEETVCRHFLLEEQGGYMSEILKRAPNLQRDVAKLRTEHQLLTVKIEALVERAEHASNVRDILESFRDWRNALSLHEDNESRLVHRVFETDDGAVD